VTSVFAMPERIVDGSPRVHAAQLGASIGPRVIRSVAVSVAVVTDTTAYLPEELIAENGIHRVSLYVTLDGEQRPESEISAGDYDDFYERLRRSDAGATTSQPSIGDFLAVYEPLLAAGHEVVSIHISSGISGTVESASQARQQLIDSGSGGERIVVWDSRSGCGGQGLMVLIAARAAARGASAAEVMERVERGRDSLRMWFAIDTLEYLRKGGRIGAAQALLGSALQIKPILTLAEEITPVERVRTRRRAFERMVEFAHERKRDGATAWVVQHIHDPDTARRLVDDCRQVFGSDPVFVSEIGPVIGAHIGPGLLGFGGVEPAALE
jgi:DegV family protein with EDD domain